jgi:hypothetical protein
MSSVSNIQPNPNVSSTQTHSATPPATLLTQKTGNPPVDDHDGDATDIRLELKKVLTGGTTAHTVNLKAQNNL